MMSERGGELPYWGRLRKTSLGRFKAEPWGNLKRGKEVRQAEWGNCDWTGGS